MQIEKSPFFRRALIPWYATDTACLVKAAVMLVFVLFGADGIKVARQVEDYNDYVWVPVLFLVFSTLGLGINLIRLVKRFTGNSAI